jgi:hypothetical protein
MLSKKEIVLNYYMKDILETHPVTNLKAILRNIKGDIGSYSKMKKAELIDRIMELKKKGFPVPKVEKYVKPVRKKVEKKPEPKKPEPKKVVDRTKIGKMILKDYTKKAIHDSVSKIKTLEEFRNYIKKSYKILDNFDSRKGASNLNPKTEKRVRILVNLFNTHAKSALQDNSNSGIWWENELPSDESAPFNRLLIDPKTKLPYGYKDFDFNDWEASQYKKGGTSIENDLDLFLEDPVSWFSYATPKQIKEMKKKSEYYRGLFKDLKSNKEDYNKVIKAHAWVKKLI